MNKEDLAKIIRSIVKEEVEKSLPNVLGEILAANVDENRMVAERVIPQEKTKMITEQPKKKASPSLVKYSSNPVLNQILNETSGGVPADPDASALVMPEMPVIGENVSILDKIKNIPQSQLNENKDVAGVLNVLKRDFRQVVRAIDSKAKNVPMPMKMSFKPGDFDAQ